MAKTKRATEELNIALSGIESALAIMEAAGSKPEEFAGMLVRVKEYAENARQALITIQFHSSHI